MVRRSFLKAFGALPALAAAPIAASRQFSAALLGSAAFGPDSGTLGVTNEVGARSFALSPAQFLAATTPRDEPRLDPDLRVARSFSLAGRMAMQRDRDALRMIAHMERVRVVIG